MSDQEDKDRVIEELRRDKEVLRRGLEDKDRAARLEELRFAKKQQWYIVTSALTLLAAIFGIATRHQTHHARRKEGGNCLRCAHSVVGL